MFVPTIFRSHVFVWLRARICVAMLGVFPRRKSRLDVRRIDIGTHRKTEDARAARSAEFPRRAIVSAPSRANARKNRRHIAESRLLLSPVLIFPRRWFGWRFPKITGEIFFARSPRAGRARATARKCAGRNSPVPKGQVVEFIESFALQNFREK